MKDTLFSILISSIIKHPTLNQVWTATSRPDYLLVGSILKLRNILLSNPRYSSSEFQYLISSFKAYFLTLTSGENTEAWWKCGVMKRLHFPVWRQPAASSQFSWLLITRGMFYSSGRAPPPPRAAPPPASKSWQMCGGGDVLLSQQCAIW